MQIVLGFTALALLIFGIFLTSYAEKEEDGAGQLSKGLFVLAISSFGYISYVVIIQGFHINGWDAILPQAVGMVIGALLMTQKGAERRFTRKTAWLMLPGFIWAAGNAAMLYANRLVGVATGFSLSQLGVVISTLGGIILLGEKKTKKEISFVIFGVILVVAGGIMIGITKQ